MKKIKSFGIKVFFALCKISLPDKYYDATFITEFLKGKIADFIKGKNLNKLILRKKIWCFIHGFLPFEYQFYDLWHNDYKKYVPTRNNYQKRTLNGSYNAILANKILFEKHFKTIISGINNLHVVESIGYIEDGNLKSLHKDVIHGRFSSLIHFLEKNDLLLKPITSDGGKGIIIIRREDDHFLLDNRKLNWEELTGILKNLTDYLIQEKFIQNGFSNNIYSGSVNTMRIATMIDPVTQEPFLAYGVHRFGSQYSGNKDNFNQGGIAAMIDLTNGKLSEGGGLSLKGEKEIFINHPTSLKPICNQRIPNWDSIINRLIEMVIRMPYLKYVGWDIILSDDELYILEGNVSPGLDIIQMFKPMAEFPLAWNFFKHYNFVE